MAISSKDRMWSTEYSYLAGIAIIIVPLLWKKQFGISYQIEHSLIIWTLYLHSRYSHSENLFTTEKPCLCITTLSILVKNGENNNKSSINERVDKQIVDIHTVEYYSAMKRNGLLIHAVIWPFQKHYAE